MGLALDYIAKKIANRSSLSLKVKERALLRTALYQAVFRKDIPLYAIGQEAGALSKKYCHTVFSGFLNAVIRKLGDGVPSLPEGKSADALSIHYSYPVLLVEYFLKVFGLEKTVDFLQLGNNPPKVMVRLRSPGVPVDANKLELIPGVPPEMRHLKDTQWLSTLAQSPSFYIQNGTPFLLMSHLSHEASPKPHSILDLCASPGGKTLLAHDLYPEAQLFANDVSFQKLERLRENCQKYHLNVALSCANGEEFVSEQLFDLIIVDAPCSNTGVLSKRPEARWRFSTETFKNLEETQRKLLRHAATLLNPHGEIWYLTCSILDFENEKLIQQVCQENDLHVRTQLTIYPTEMGLDGGFACALQRK
jgi:16S rRNA (cytosine967-C5)-methyltransferase